MRTFCAFVLLLFSVLYFSSCQKQLSDSTLFPPQQQADSIFLVNTSLEVDYDSSGAFLYQEWQRFVYDTLSNRTIVNIADSNVYEPGRLKTYTATFQYNAGKKLVQYTSTGGYEPAAKIDFVYNAAGDIVKSTIEDNWLGKTFDCWYSTTRTNGQTSIIVYDTSGNYDTGPFGADTRPEKTYYIFDGGDRLVQRSLQFTYYRQPNNLYLDTLTENLHYNSQQVFDMSTSRQSYHPGVDVPFTVVNRDSSQFTGEQSTAALKNSFLYVYRNMYWLTISEFGTGFSNVLNGNHYALLSGMALKAEAYWNFDGSDTVPTEYFQGVFNNTFDADGLLIKSVTPKNLGNKYGGRTEYFYSYTKLKK